MFCGIVYMHKGMKYKIIRIVGIVMMLLLACVQSAMPIGIVPGNRQKSGRMFVYRYDDRYW